MNGCFDIQCTADDAGRSHISHQQVSAPWHLGKPYWNGSTLLVQAVNATAGIFAGDALSLRARIEPGASVLLTSPSASRIHTMQGGEASLDQHIEVATGAWLEWMPELFIPQRSARYRQSTAISVNGDGGLYFVETFAPGRVAHGELFAFEQLVWNTRVSRDGALLLAERYMFRHDNGSLVDLKRGPGSGYFASAILVTPLDLPWRERQTAIHALAGESVKIGATQIDEGAFLIRLIADDSLALKESLANVRALLAADLNALRQTARKL